MVPRHTGGGLRRAPRAGQLDDDGPYRRNVSVLLEEEMRTHVRHTLLAWVLWQAVSGVTSTSVDFRYGQPLIMDTFETRGRRAASGWNAT